MAELTAGGDSRSPFDLAFSLLWESFLLCELGGPRPTEIAATRALAIAEEHDFPFIRNQARVVIGWARAHLEMARKGVALIHSGLAGHTESGARIRITDSLRLLAQAQALDGMSGEALSTIEGALQANPEEIVFRPNIMNCRGELRFKQGQTDLAEADFREAIALAKKMNGKGWELRATINLARLLSSQDRRDEARITLAEIYNWFTEGFDTADLKDAKTLLDELST
jgi:predicted ATPase